MEIFGNKNAALTQMTKITRKGFDDIARSMRSIINDQIEVWRTDEYLGFRSVSIGITDDDVDARVVISQFGAIRIDVAANQGLERSGKYLLQISNEPPFCIPISSIRIGRSR